MTFDAMIHMFECNLPPSLARLVPRIDLAAITTFIDGVPCLTDYSEPSTKSISSPFCQNREIIGD